MPTIVESSPDEPDLADTLYPLMLELRPNLTREGFDAMLRDGCEQGLRALIARDRDGRPLGLAFFRVLTTSRGRILFLDDLVTAATVRGQGVGAELLQALGSRARAGGCERIELDSGVTNHGAHRFYHRHGMRIGAFHFALDTP